MLSRVLWFLLAIPAGLLLIVVMFANRHWVPLSLDPFRDLETSVLSFNLPLYAYILASLIAGVVLGGVATWFTQGRWRKTARVRGQDALRWEAEASRLQKERDVAISTALPLGQGNQGSTSRGLVPLTRR